MCVCALTKLKLNIFLTNKATQITLKKDQDFPLMSLLHYQECPNGTVDKDTFKKIYAQFFPYGGMSEMTSAN